MAEVERRDKPAKTKRGAEMTIKRKALWRALRVYGWMALVLWIGFSIRNGWILFLGVALGLLGGLWGAWHFPVPDKKARQVNGRAHGSGSVYLG